jgi:hypothetical protein
VYLLEELLRRQVVGDGNVVVGIGEDEIVLLLAVHDEPPAVGVVARYPRVLRQAEMVVDDLCHLGVYLDDVDLRPG